MAVEAYPGRFTNHLILPADPEDFGESLWSWTAEARRFRAPGLNLSRPQIK